MSSLLVLKLPLTKIGSCDRISPTDKARVVFLYCQYPANTKTSHTSFSRPSTSFPLSSPMPPTTSYIPPRPMGYHHYQERHSGESSIVAFPSRPQSPGEQFQWLKVEEQWNRTQSPPSTETDKKVKMFYSGNKYVVLLVRILATYC